MRVSEVNKEPRSPAKIERDTGYGKQRHCFRAIVDVIPFVFSLVSFAFCFLLSIQTSEIKDRVVDLEIGSGARTFSPFGLSMDQFNSMVQERVDKLLSQRSYEHLARIRTARQASSDCNCPPGPPGKRGRRGRNGDPAITSSSVFTGPPVRGAHSIQPDKSCSNGPNYFLEDTCK
ncbi:collagen alpha-1(XXV) chain-like [Xyrauchen texanus]|uniref:collagen alpha-1(XXV) chain-like n=1 Tax=Xyrauchen texanus TaxID=154827 RepID=UPI0022422401|nr:collagen alpha-1(XXV) chain-like [Xyrauchen texanus]